MIEGILNKKSLSKSDIIELLKCNATDSQKLFEKSALVKAKNVGNKVYYRGLIEFSNICEKDCYYCGIRQSNKNFKRYNLSDKDILDAARFAYRENYGSIALQSGELNHPAFTQRIEKLLKAIKALSDHKLGITISLGEQSKETYQKWLNAGADRYLLRIETSNPDLYYKIHPQNQKHNHEQRIECIRTLRELGYQTGTGIMIGLPFQSYDDLANDLIFMKNMDIDMCGMGPFIEHSDTPLYQYKDELLSLEERFLLSLKTIAVLRLMMPDINIAAATALQAIDPKGREKAIQIGANVLMPNITPGMYRDNYNLYHNKPQTKQSDSDYKNHLEKSLADYGNTVEYGECGNSLHFKKRLNLNR